MALFKKHKTEPVPPEDTGAHDTSVGTAADVEAVMKKYDRESNTRVWEGLPKLVIRWLMVAFSAYCIIDTVFLSTRQEVRLPMFVGLILLFGFLTFPAKKGDERVNHMPWYDIVLLIAGPGAYFFYAVNAQNVVQMSARVMQNDLYMIIGLIGILALVELCRRCVGLPILCVAGVLLVYTFFNLGGSADFKMTLYQVIRTMFYTFNGIFGGPISVCAKFIVVFIIFGAFLERTGIAQFFINLANAVAGAAPGGPAKVAVISSALCGMVSGSSVGNTVTTGSVTIPMMKKTGYKPEFAGAVEAAASTGGQIMPPIMGAAAFLMAEFTGEPYGTIAMRAILPAVLYFTGIYIAVHLEAKKLGLKGIPREQLPRVRQLLPKIYLLAPLVLLVVMVSTNMYTMAFSAAIAIVAAVAVGLVNNVVEIASKSSNREDFLRQDHRRPGGRRQGLHHCGGGLRRGRHYLRLHHGDGPGLQAVEHNRQPLRRPHDYRPGADHALLHRAGHGRADHRQLLHHGGHLRSHPDGSLHRCHQDGGPLLRVLLRHCGGHHAAGGPGGLCRQRHCQGGSHEDRVQRHETGHSGLYRAVHLRFQPPDALCGCDWCLPGGADLHQRPAGHLRRGGGPQRIPVPAHPRAAAGGHGRGRPGYDDSRHGHRHRRLCVGGWHRPLSALQRPARRHGLNDLESAPRLPGSTFSHIPASYKRYGPREKL